jgi:hypothetical protein
MKRNAGCEVAGADDLVWGAEFDGPCSIDISRYDISLKAQMSSRFRAFTISAPTSPAREMIEARAGG